MRIDGIFWGMNDGRRETEPTPALRMCISEASVMVQCHFVINGRRFSCWSGAIETFRYIVSKYRKELTIMQRRLLPLLYSRGKAQINSAKDNREGIINFEAVLPCKYPE